MNDKAQTGSGAGSAPDWANLWQSMAETSNRMVEAWSGFDARSALDSSLIGLLAGAAR